MFKPTFNPLPSGVAFLYPLKKSENHYIIPQVRGYKKGTPVSKELMKELITTFLLESVIKEDILIWVYNFQSADSRILFKGL